MTRSDASPIASAAALVLAGGRSARMRSPKPNVILRDGRTMLEHVVAALEPLQIPVHLSVAKGVSEPLLARYLPIIEDPEEFPGPLAAVAHALEQIAADRLFVVCCDQPLMQPDFLQRLLDSSREHPTFFRDDAGEEYTPFPGVFPKSSLPTMRDALGRGERSPRRFAASVPCSWVGINAQEAATLVSFNTREQLAEAGLLANGADPSTNASNTDSWYRLSLGDANMADEVADDVVADFEQERAGVADARGMALLRRLETRGDVHCELVLYFPPPAAAFAVRHDAHPCSTPARQGLDMLVGSPEDWTILFG